MLSVKTLRGPVALRYVLIFAIALTLGCSDNRQTDDRRKKARDYFRSTNMIIPADDAVATFPPPPNSMAAKPAPNPQRNAYFGDMHVHTKLSFDATAFGTTATPADAYRYAQGEAIKHPGGFEVQLARPLDFYAVTDHAMFLGLINDAIDTNTEFSKYELSKPYHNMNDEVSGDLFDMNTRNNVFNNFTADVVANLLDGTFDAEVVNKVSKSAWQRTIEAANAAYQPGKFTTFVGYEFTPQLQRARRCIAMLFFAAASGFRPCHFRGSTAWIPTAFGAGWMCCVTRVWTASPFRITAMAPMA